MDAREYDDSRILSGTTLEPVEGGLARLAFTLPGGRILRSDAGPPDELRKRMIAWCNAVRDNISADAKEKELAARRTYEDTAAAAAAKEIVEDEAVTPEAYITKQIAIAAKRLKAAEKKMAEAVAEIEAASGDKKRWDAALAAIGSV